MAFSHLFFYAPYYGRYPATSSTCRTCPSVIPLGQTPRLINSSRITDGSQGDTTSTSFLMYLANCCCSCRVKQDINTSYTLCLSQTPSRIGEPKVTSLLLGDIMLHCSIIRATVIFIIRIRDLEKYSNQANSQSVKIFDKCVHHEEKQPRFCR